MIYHKKTNFIFFLLSIIFLAMSIPVSLTIKNHYVGSESEKVEQAVSRNISLVRSNFEASIFMDTFLADSLATLVTIDPVMAISNWNTIASQLLNKAQNVRNVTIAPNNIIRYVYPLEGNEPALGIDLSSVSAQNKAIEIAKQSQHVYLDGPVELVQGGKGLIARYPIFSDYPHNKAYWGTVSVVINYDQLLERSGLYDIKGAQIAVKNITDVPKLIYGDATTFEQPDVQHYINLPSGRWELVAKFNLQESPHIKFIERTVVTICFVTSCLLYALLFLIYKNYKNIHTAAMHDELTHLPNRRYMNTLLKKVVEGKDNRTFFTLLSIDVNDFKSVNDNYGHDIGDQFLKFIASKLKENTRTTDTVARIGGDEFLVVLNHISHPDQVQNIIESIRKKIESEHFFHHNQMIRPSLSIGYAIYDSGMDIDTLISKADHSMYVNKNAHAFSKKDFTV